MVMELYDARREAREYLDYYVNPDENKELEKFKKIRLEIPFVNLFLQNTTARLTRRMRWAKHNTTPYIQTSNIDKCVQNPCRDAVHHVSTYRASQQTPLSYRNICSVWFLVFTFPMASTMTPCSSMT